MPRYSANASALSISLPEARRIALAAQGFGASNRSIRTVQRVHALITQLGAVQIDSVNVLVRSHYLPLFSRGGAYPRTLLERAAYAPSGRKLFEYWGHEASLLPVELFPLMRWRMARALAGEGTWKRLQRYATEHADLVDAALVQIRERGPMGASDLENAGKSSGSWWGWSQGKEILEWLFWIGRVTTSSRRHFERIYDLTERVLPAEVLVPTPSKADAQRALLQISAAALGVATLRDLRDYFRLPTEDAASRSTELVEEGVLMPVSVEGWKQQGFLHRDAQQTARVDVAALLSPFDSLIWERQRTERIFDFHYRLEIYTPLAKRKHGYYVLPFLLGDKLVARVDLKSNRQDCALEVRGASVEAGVSEKAIAPALYEHLQALASWLELDQVKLISRRGDLLRALRNHRSINRPRSSPTNRKRT